MGQEQSSIPTVSEEQLDVVASPTTYGSESSSNSRAQKMRKIASRNTGSEHIWFLGFEL